MRRWNNQIKTVLLLGALSAAFVGMGSALGAGYLYAFALLAMALNLGAYFFSDRLVLRLHRARQVGPEEIPRLHEMVAELAHAMGIPKPRILLIEDDHANAFATGRNPRRGAVAVTRGLVVLLTPRELRAVLAHELGHIRNRDVLVASVAAAMAAAVTYVAQALQVSALWGAHHDEQQEHETTTGGLLLALVAPLAATLVQLGVSRVREFLADERAAVISGDPLALASALEKLERGADLIHPSAPQPATASLFIVNPLRAGGWVTNLFSTHPSTAQRVQQLLPLARKWQRVAA